MAVPLAPWIGDLRAGFTATQDLVYPELVDCVKRKPAEEQE